jgi:tRNA (guanine9-N1)-methyltransferase
MSEEQPLCKSKNQLKREAKINRKKEIKSLRRLQHKKKRSKRFNLKKLPEKYGTLIVDVSFCELMNEKETSSLCNQLTRLYASNRRSARPFDIIFHDPDYFLREKYLKSRYPDCERWDILWKGNFQLESSSCVYLTGDSPNVLTEFEANKIYILGGLVDRNRHKSITYEKAVGLGISTARLPIKENIALKSTHILTLIHVFEILLKFKMTNDWKKSIEDSLPQRKL